MKNISIKTTASVAAIALVGSALSLIILGGATMIPLTPVAVIAGSVLTGVVAAVIMMVVMAAGYGGQPTVPSPETGPAAHADFSVTDPLTRTMNRRGITIGIMDAMALGERYGNPLSVAKLDLDSLSGINEKYGKDIGDRILAGVAAVLADALRMPDKIGRFGDDEFILVMPQTRIDDAFMIADRLRKLVEQQEFDVDGATDKITTSVGVTEYMPGDDLESLISRVQQGVDKSRDAGRNTVTRV